MANEVATSFSDGLMRRLDAVHEALPANFNKTRFVQNCLSIMNEKPELATYNRDKLFAGLLKGAYLGLDFFKKECYLIPYGKDLQFQTDYKGEIKYVKKYATSPIKDIYAELVREGDVFQKKIVDGQQTIDFEPVAFSQKAVVGAFAVVTFKDGSMQSEVMSTEEINAVRSSYSKAANSKPWKNSWGEMARKVVLRRLCKHIDTDFSSANAMEAWNEGSGMDFSDQNVVKKATVVEDDPFANIEEDDIFDGEMEVVDGE